MAGIGTELAKQGRPLKFDLRHIALSRLSNFRLSTDLFIPEKPMQFIEQVLFVFTLSPYGELQSEGIG
jgi:hypothetical protein